MLIENTLWGERNKVDIAIKRLREYEPPEGYYLAFSGGKDSVTILRLAQMAGVRFDAHYNVTTVDPPELVKFIKQQHPNVERHRPEISMFRLILYKRWPPMRYQRYCCEVLKERLGRGRLVMTGVRWAESPRRARRRMVEACLRDKSKQFFHPIIDWLNEDVWEFISQENVPYCSLYDENFDRLGCVLCPMQQCTLRERDAKRWPKFAKAYIRTFDRLVVQRAAEGDPVSFESGQAMFDWWISGDSRKKQPEAQMVLFE